MRFHAPAPLLAVLLSAIAGCAAPAQESAPVDVTPVADEVDPATLIQLKFPDFQPLSYDGRGGCWDAVANKAVYRFVISNKGTAAGTIPMIKVDIHLPYGNSSPKFPDGSTYYFWNVALAAGEQKVLVVDLGFHPYDQAYTVTTTADPANRRPAARVWAGKERRRLIWCVLACAVPRWSSNVGLGPPSS